MTEYLDTNRHEVQEQDLQELLRFQHLATPAEEKPGEGLGGLIFCGQIFWQGTRCLHRLDMGSSLDCPPGIHSFGEEYLAYLGILYPVAPWPRGPWLPLLLRPVGKLSMLSEIVKVVDGEGGGDLKYCRPENFLVCRKNFPPIVETRQKNDPLYSFRFKFQIQIQIHIQI